MPSTEWRYKIVETARGPAALVGGPRGLAAVILPGLPAKRLLAEVRRRFPDAGPGDRGLRAAARTLEGYFRTGKLAGRAPRLDLDGVGDFRRRVYEELGGVAPGQTVTYAELARRIGRPAAHRSVGTALSRNPIPLFVPCHRVLRSDGGLGGFTAEGGLELKAAMLRLEGVPV